jgi:predicted protein tyrosine phosphatase
VKNINAFKKHEVINNARAIDNLLIDKLISTLKMSNSLNLLFICSRNQWRSPTGEEIWKKRPGFNARSAGTSPHARKTVGPADIRWADYIFVMEKKHKNKLLAEFTRMMDHKPLYVLDIPDEYKYMDPELVDELECKVSDILEREANT